MDKWLLTTVQAYQVECRSCGRRVVSKEPAQKAMAIFITQGWQLKSGAPWCPQCVMDDDVNPDGWDYHK